MNSDPTHSAIIQNTDKSVSNISKPYTNDVTYAYTLKPYGRIQYAFSKWSVTPVQFTTITGDWFPVLYNVPDIVCDGITVGTTTTDNLTVTVNITDSLTVNGNITMETITTNVLPTLATQIGYKREILTGEVYTTSSTPTNYENITCITDLPKGVYSIFFSGTNGDNQSSPTYFIGLSYYETVNVLDEYSISSVLGIAPPGYYSKYKAQMNVIYTQQTDNAYLYLNHTSTISSLPVSVYFSCTKIG